MAATWAPASRKYAAAPSGSARPVTARDSSGAPQNAKLMKGSTSRSASTAAAGDHKRAQ